MGVTAIIITVVVVMAMLVIMMMPVVRTTFGRISQRSTQKAGDEFLDQHARLAGAHVDALPRKEVECSSANATGNDRVDALSVKPARKESGGVRRSRDCPLGNDCLAISISVHKGELAAAAEMAVEPAVFSGNGDPDD
jgi:hypothetical protein